MQNNSSSLSLYRNISPVVKRQKKKKKKKGGGGGGGGNRMVSVNSLITDKRLGKTKTLCTVKKHREEEAQ